AGALADRFPRHRLLVATGIGQAVTATTIGALTISGLVSLLPVLVLTFVAGAVRGGEQAARQSYTHDVVGPARLVNGLAGRGVAMRAGWLLGSLGVGLLIAHFGSGVAYVAVAAGYLSGASALLPASAAATSLPPAPGSLWHSVIGFLTAIRRDRILPLL